jgi:hypothetical protein
VSVAVNTLAVPPAFFTINLSAASAGAARAAIAAAVSKTLEIIFI